MDEWDEIFQNLEKDIVEEGVLPKGDDRWNARISKITELEHVLVASFITPEMNIRDINMMIIVLSGTTRQDIIDDWQEISDYQDRLAKSWGKLKKPELAYRQNAFRMHRDYKMGYGNIAKFLNFHILVLLLYGYSLNKVGRKFEADFFIQSFKDHLVAFGYSKEDAKEYFNLANDELKMENFPWRLDNGPFHTMNIRNNLREFVKKDNDGFLILNRSLETLDEYCLHHDIERILIELYRNTFKMNKSDRSTFNKWEKIKKEIIEDFVLNLRENLAPEIPDMSLINLFLP